MVWDYYPSYTYQIWRQGQSVVYCLSIKYRYAPDFDKTGMNRQCLLLKNCGIMDSASLALSRQQRETFPMTYLSNIYFQNQGDMIGLLTRPVERTNPELDDFFCMDRNRRYFIFTGISMEKGRPYNRTRWRQESPSPSSELNMVELTITQPIIAELYYITCGQSDRQNSCRQESHDIEKMVGTKDWSKRFNLSVFTMNVVNAWFAYQGITGTAYKQADLYHYLAKDMIDNTYDRFMIQISEGRRRNIVDSDDKTFDDENPLFGRINGAPRCGKSLHVTTTKKRRNKRYGTQTQYLLQGE